VSDPTPAAALDIGERARIVRQTRSVAVLGASANPARASYFVSTYLLASTDYEVYFVNPTVSEILGRPVYPSLAALPVVPDLVDVFRRASELDEALTDTIQVGAKTFWLQLGLTDAAVEQRAADAGLQVVADRCLKIEHARFAGGLHLAGFDTGVIDSRRY
jgi:predicted CoA-binding protein